MTQVNIVRVMEEELGIKGRAARALFDTGKVTLDGYVLRWRHRSISEDRCYGRMLNAMGREVRLVGSRLSKDVDGSQQV